MKYFNNITTAEELKKQFRVYCVSMHPDKGGDPEEFKTMAAEYNNIVCFSFANGDSGEDDIIGYKSDTEVISVLGKACNSHIDCEAIETIEVYKQ